MKFLAIVPAFNEEKSIGMVVARIKLQIPKVDVVVINDGSIDSTSIRAVASGAVVIDLPFNLGIGGAMQTGYLYAKQNDYDIAVQVDGDGQHDPSYIGNLIEPVEKGLTDMAIGSRYITGTSYQSTLFRRMGMIFFSSLVKVLTGCKVKDTTSGFRAINRKIIDYFAERYPVDYPEVDVLIKLFRRKYRIVEVPVEMNQRHSGKSSITPIRSIYYIIKVSLSLLMGTLRSDKE